MFVKVIFIALMVVFVGTCVILALSPLLGDLIGQNDAINDR